MNWPEILKEPFLLKKELIKSLKANREFDRKVAEEWKATEADSGWGKGVVLESQFF